MLLLLPILFLWSVSTKVKDTSYRFDLIFSHGNDWIHENDWILYQELSLLLNSINSISWALIRREMQGEVVSFFFSSLFYYFYFNIYIYLTGRYTLLLLSKASNFISLQAPNFISLHLIRVVVYFYKIQSLVSVWSWAVEKIESCISLILSRGKDWVCSWTRKLVKRAV